MEIQIDIARFHSEKDKRYIEDITGLLHRSYAPLAAMGLRYLATHQSPEVTFSRLCEGEAYLIWNQGVIIGTVTLKPTRKVCSSNWYASPGVFHFGQFAIDPNFQGRGIGSQIMNHVELRATELGASELALDTSERADQLISLYTKRGYRFVENVQWEGVNYRSVILSKTLR